MAAYQVGLRHLEADGAARDEARAVSLFRTAAAAAGHADARFRLGLAHQSGIGAERNASTTARWFRLAA